MKIIVDTSVWIEYLKNSPPIAENLDQLLLAGNIYTVGPVIAEILQGAKTEKDYRLLENNLGGLPLIETKVEDWIKAGKISYELRKRGITITLTDCLIAAVAIHQNASVMTYDRRFESIPDLKHINVPD